MKIAQIIPSLAPTGPVNVALDLTHLFREMGHEVQLFYFDEKEGAVSDSGAVQIGFNEKRDWSKFDIVHSHGLRPDVYVRRNYKQMPPAVSTLHNYLKDDLKFQYNPIIAAVFSPVWNWACARHKANVVLSRHMKSYYSRFWRNKNIEVIPNTRVIDLQPNPNRIEEIKKLAEGRKVLGSISTLNPRKGVNQVLPFLAQNPDWVYIHVGGGQLDDLKAEAAKLKVIDRCHFIGPQKQGWQYAPAFDVFILPSLSEGFPLSLIEAIQLGVPVVCSDIPVFREIFSESEVSLFTLNDTNSLSNAVLRTYAQKDNFVQNALARFQREYSPEIVAEKYLELYRSIV